MGSGHCSILQPVNPNWCHFHQKLRVPLSWQDTENIELLETALQSGRGVAHVRPCHTNSAEWHASDQPTRAQESTQASKAPRCQRSSRIINNRRWTRPVRWSSPSPCHAGLFSVFTYTLGLRSDYREAFQVVVLASFLFEKTFPKHISKAGNTSWDSLWTFT